MKKLLLIVLLFFGIYNISNADIDISLMDTNFTFSNSPGYDITGYEFNYDDSIVYYLQGSNLRDYEISLSGSIATLGSFTNEINIENLGCDIRGSYFGGLEFGNNGKILYIHRSGGGLATNVGGICAFNLSTAYDLSSISFDYYLTGFGFRDFTISDDGLTVAGVSYSPSYNYYNLSIPFDLNSVISSGSVAHTYSLIGIEFFDNNLYFQFYYVNNPWFYVITSKLDYKTNGIDNPVLLQNKGTDNNIAWFTNLKFSNKGNYLVHGQRNQPIIKFLNTNSLVDVVIPILDLEIINEGNIETLENGIRLNGLETNNDFSLTYEITEWDGTASYYKDSGDLGSFSGGINNIDFLNNENFSFINLVNYDLEINLTDINNPSNVITKYYNSDYNYNSGYIEPVIENFNFFVSGYSFFENGFSLDNFVPEPSGGELYFEIIAPAINGTGTINITTEIFLPYTINGAGYGFDSSVLVTYPYHQTPGIYQVRTVYKYEDLVIYPFGNDYNSYTITLAESPANYEVELLYICDTDGNGLTEIAESLACPFVILKYYSVKIIDNANGLKEFFIKIMNIGTNEVKTFSFIETTNANFLDNMQPIEEQNNVLSKLYYFIKGFLYLVFLILSILLIIYLKKN